MQKNKKKYKLILDNNVLAEYSKYYFKKHPRAKKMPIEKPWHPSLNTWCILTRIRMNALKQQWKNFIIWWIKSLGLENEQLNSFSITSTVFFNTKHRHDVDNYVIKFIADGFTESGFIVDDSEKYLHSLTLKTGYDKEHPRTEIEIFVE